jgi:hypothetical protein
MVVGRRTSTRAGSIRMDPSRGINIPHLLNGKTTIGTETEREITEEEIGTNIVSQTTVQIKAITTIITTTAAVIILKKEGLRTVCRRDRRMRVLGSEPPSQ